MKKVLVFSAVIMVSTSLFSQVRKQVTRLGNHISNPKPISKITTYCYKNIRAKKNDDITYTSIVEITLTITNGTARGHYSNTIQRNGSFIQEDNEDLTGKVIDDVIQAVVISSHTEQTVNWKKTSKKNIKLSAGKTIMWNGIELKKCGK